MIEIPHLAFPFTLNATTGSVEVVEQDSVDHVMACEQVIVRCPLGYRIERPEFGWPFPEFQTGEINLTALEAALAEFEPRGNANAQQWVDVADSAFRHIQVEVQSG